MFWQRASTAGIKVKNWSKARESSFHFVAGFMKAVYLVEQVMVHWSVLSPAVTMGQQLDGGTAPHWGPRCPSVLWKPGYFQDTSTWAQEFRSIASFTSLPEARVMKGALSEFLKQRQIFLFKNGWPLAFVVPVEGLFCHILIQQPGCKKHAGPAYLLLYLL